MNLQGFTSVCDNEKHGQGKHTWANGAKYVDDWRDDKRTVHGEETWADAGKYVGEWQNGQVLEYTWAVVCKQQGRWMHGRLSGSGTAKAAHDARCAQKPHVLAVKIRLFCCTRLLVSVTSTQHAPVHASVQLISLQHVRMESSLYNMYAIVPLISSQHHIPAQLRFCRSACCSCRPT